MLRAFGADPLVIKETRVDALWGVTNLMDRAAAAAPRLPPPALLLYGEKDQIIPKAAFCAALRELPREPGLRLVLYPEGWHMLTRDLQGRQVMEDIAAWLLDRDAPLPSGEEAAPDSRRLARFCPPAKHAENRAVP
jgi:alpha-beta hydrolase superfamily lysophospholipase